MFSAVGHGRPDQLPGLVGWTVIAVSVCFLVVTGRRQLTSGRRTTRLIEQLEETLESFSTLTQTSLEPLPLEGLLQQLLERLGAVLATDVSAIFIGDDDEYVLRAAHGIKVSEQLDQPLVLGHGLLAAMVSAGLCRPCDDPETLELLGSRFGYALASSAACPIVIDGRAIGVCVVASSAHRHFDPRQLQFLKLVSDRVGVDIELSRRAEAEQRSGLESERLRLHSVLLARTSEILLNGIDDFEASIAALVEIVVPALADECEVSFTDGKLRMDTGDTRGEAEADSQLSDDGRRLVVAIVAGNAVVGTIAMAVGPDRPPYVEGDLLTAGELAVRVGVTVERVARYREAEQAAEVSQGRAARLQELVSTSIEAQQRHVVSEVLTTIAEGACRAFGAELAVVTPTAVNAGSEAPIAQGIRASAMTRSLQNSAVVDPPIVSVPWPVTDPNQTWRAGGWLGVTSLGAKPEAGIRLAIQAPQGHEFSSDQETASLLLGQIALAALDNIHMYEAAQLSESRWRVLVEAAPIAILEITVHGEVEWWNRASARLFDWPVAMHRQTPQDQSSGGDPTEPLGPTNGQPTFAPATAAKLRPLWEEVMAGSAVIDRELQTTTSEGDELSLVVSAVLLHSPTGQASGILTLVSDVTERRQLEEELRGAQRMEVIGQLASTVAHDFNNLLTLINGYVELLKRRVNDEDVLDLVTGVQTATTKASLLTAQLLVISRRQIVRPVTVQPAEVLRSAAAVLERILGEGVAVTWDLQADAGEVSIDIGGLEQMILNLAVNARDAMPRGGHVRIGVSGVVVDGPLSIELGTLPGRYVKVSVADNGIGMDPQTCRSCFEPLFTTKGPFLGSGLGLTAVKEVASGAGGSVSVKSTPGLGSTFEVFLPALAGAVAVSPVPDPGTNSAGATSTQPGTVVPPPASTILIAEDDRAVRQLMYRVLVRAGYCVLQAADGEAAVSLAEQFDGTIDAIVSDVNMPKATGPQVVDLLLKTRPNMRVLFISGGDKSGTVMPDPMATLAKPFKPSELLSRVGDLMAH